MKLLSSPFSLSSSSTFSSTTTSYSFDSKSAAASCIAGILRRILCSGTLPTYPADHSIIPEDAAADDTVKCFRDFNPNDHDTSNPGLVARLMGLDSMPETNFRTSLFRSRSANSADGLIEDAAIHRRVKPTASFREGQLPPVFLELQDKDFFVLSFEGARESRAKSEKGCGESKPRQRVRARSEESEDRELDMARRSGGECITLVPKKTPCRKNEPREEKYRDNVAYSNGAKQSLKKKKKKKKKKRDSELVCEDSSPVSVLDCGQFLVDPRVPKSITEVDCSSRRKLSLEGEEPSPRKDDKLIGVGRKTEKEYSNVFEEICRVSESESLDQKWDSDHRNFHGIGEEFEAWILGELIQELVDQFLD